jgi:G3E family GTPase
VITAARQIPVTLLTGYLGAGKTTLLNRILSEKHGKRYAVVVNEFGEVGIDSDLVIDADEEVVQMNNGCVCCSVRGDLIRILGGLMKRAERFDGILLETTGLADPAPVAQTFFVDDDIRRRIKLDAVVTVVDAHHFLEQVDSAPEAREQIAFADIGLVNKCDLASADQLAKVEARIRSINPFAKLYNVERCHVDITDILDRGAFDLDRILETEPGFLEHVHSHGHDDQITSLSLVSRQPLAPARFLDWIQDVTQRFGPDLLRMKGVVAMQDDDDRFVVQAVHMLVEGNHQRAWRKNEPRHSRVVLIGRNLPGDVLRQGFEACQA